MSTLPTNVSSSTRKRNPHLYPSDFKAIGSGDFDVLMKKGKTLCKVFAAEAKPKERRLRQSQRPLLNKLETEWLEVLRRKLGPGANIHCQAWRVRLANGAWFKVDMCAVVGTYWTAWECKGPKQMKNVDRGMLALKCAADRFPEVRWVLVWKQNGQWKEQVIQS